MVLKATPPVQAQQAAIQCMVPALVATTNIQIQCKLKQFVQRVTHATMEIVFRLHNSARGATTLLQVLQPVLCARLATSVQCRTQA